MHSYSPASSHCSYSFSISDTYTHVMYGCVGHAAHRVSSCRWVPRQVGPVVPVVSTTIRAFGLDTFCYVMDILTDVYDIDGSEFISIYLVQAKPGWTVVSGFSFLLSAGSEDRPLVGCCTTPQRSSLITSHRHPHLRVAINGLRDAAWSCT